VTCQITFLPVGNADSIVIQTDNSIVIVDLGKLNILEEWLEKHQISRIDRIYITHVTQKPKKVSETAIPSEIAAKP
jgi:beta-lactamase superfamily II metal-dependent hydrolase